jgi:hypothetical protein
MRHLTLLALQRHKKVIPTFFPETPTFYEKDRLKAKKQISRRELFKKFNF